MAASLRRAAVLGLAAAAGGTSAANPFEGKSFYLNPANQLEYDGSIATATGVVQENLRKMRDVPSAYWIDVKEKIRGTTTDSLEGMLKDAAAKSPPELVVVIWYDLPNRDCNANASNGQICCSKNPDGTCNYDATGDCKAGLKEYASDFVDPIIAVLKEYEKVPIVVILEPDSLPNLATNSGHPRCGNPATQAAYKQGVKYAMEQLTTQAPSVGVYLDATHGGWLGWEDSLEDFIFLLKDMDLPMNKIRGFSTNVANYQALGEQCPWEPDEGFRNGYCLNGKHASDPCCAEDPCKLLGEYNPGNGELNYAQALVRAGNAAFGIDARVVIDTGRNGVPNERTDCANWCNPRGAGAGIASTTKTANATFVDAYFWLKTPGESDGCSQTLPDGSQCKRYDSMCGSVDSLGTKASEPHAPEAGQWFDFQVKMLAENAQLAPPGRCCWGAAGATTCAQMSSCQGDWCGASEDHCTNNCRGTWCSKANDKDWILGIVV